MPNKSFKPNLLRYGNGVAEKACHAVAFTAQVGLTQALAPMIIIHLLAALLLIPAGAEPDHAHSTPELLESDPVIIPPDFCILQSGPEATCSAGVSFLIHSDGSVADITITQSSRNRDCDRAVIASVKSRRYAASETLQTTSEYISSQTCRAMRGR